MIFNPACAADMEAEVVVACGTPECCLPSLVGNISVHSGLVRLQILVVLGSTDHAKLLPVGMFGEVFFTPCRCRRSDCGIVHGLPCRSPRTFRKM